MADGQPLPDEPQIESLREEMKRLESVALEAEIQYHRARSTYLAAQWRVEEKQAQSTAKARLAERQERARRWALGLLDGPLLARLNTMLRVPKDREDEFRERLLDLFTWEFATRKPPRRTFQVSTKERGSFVRGCRIAIDAISADQGLREMHGCVVDVLNRALSEHKTSRGRPSQLNRCGERFALFADSLMKTTWLVGGKLTITPRNGGSGSLVDLMKELRPLLQPGFIPDPLPLSLLEKRQAEIKKAFARR